MITKKSWNSLNNKTRKRIVDTIYYDKPEEFKNMMAQEWHHNNDADHDYLFSKVSWITKDVAVKVTINFNV